MSFASQQIGLSIPDSPKSDTIVINGRCTLRKDGKFRVVYVAGLPMHHWTDGDSMAEAYAMISLIKCGYADQREVASAFGYSTRTLRRYQNRYEVGGMSVLGRTSGRPRGTYAKPNPWVQRAATLKRSGITSHAIARSLSVSVTCPSEAILH